MLNGKWKGDDIGSGTDVWKFSEAVRAGDMSLQDFMAAESGMSRSKGVCMTMGTASTMASLVEAMGLSLPTNAALPAVDSRRMALAHLTGNRIVEMVEEDLKPSDILTRAAFENAIMANAAVGGSTNAVVHLLAIAGRVGVDLTLKDIELGGEIPLLVNCMPSGKYLMEDFCYAGGMPVVLNELGAIAAQGDNRARRRYRRLCRWRRMLQPRRDPPHRRSAETGGGPARAARQPRPRRRDHQALRRDRCAAGTRRHGACVRDIEDMKANIDRDDLPVTPDTILVLKGCGPKGYPGMPEVGNMPIPKKLVQQGVRDMVRVSDARMSGTAYGTVVLHVSPEAQAGGALALVQTGDRIRLSASEGRLELLISDAELAARRAAWTPDPPRYDARLREDVCRSRPAGRPGRRSRLPHRQGYPPRDPRKPLTRPHAPFHLGKNTSGGAGGSAPRGSAPQATKPHVKCTGGARGCTPGVRGHPPKIEGKQP